MLKEYLWILFKVERLEESNAELLSNITTMERQKRDAEAKAAHCVSEKNRFFFLLTAIIMSFTEKTVS